MSSESSLVLNNSATLLVTQSSQSQCIKESAHTCQIFNKSQVTCFGATLPYDSTSFELVTDANNFNQAHEKLLLWSGLKAVPRCWDVIQPLLCSVYYPSCENKQIHLPDRSLCEATRNPCKIVHTEYGWPDFLQCFNNDVFRDGCADNRQLLTFNKSTCEPPLIATNNSKSFYDEVEGCGLQCMNPLYNEKEHDEIHTFIAVWASLACICTLFAMLSFFIDWKNASKYPARIIFYMNLCFFATGVGWLVQFFPNAREEIVCRKDGTMRLAEPVGSGETASCILVFILVYFTVMSGIIWFDILAYSWFLMFKALGTYEDPLIGKEKRFHFIAWGIPAILTLIGVAVSQVDGDSMSGICFIGYKNYIYRLGFLLIPVGLVLVVGGFFIIRGLAVLFSIKNTTGLLSDTAVSKINWTMIRIGAFAILAFASVLVTFAAHVYDYTNQALWEKSFREYIKCEANVTILEQLSGSPVQQCQLQSHPSISILKLNLIALFGTGIVMSTWVWTRSSAANWRRAWYKLIGRSDNEMKRIKKKSRIIARAFANRSIFRRKDNARHVEIDEGELEYSEHTMSHDDPVGMDLNLRGSISQDNISSAWIHNVPKMVERRGGILPDGRSSVRASLDFCAAKCNPMQERQNGVLLEPGLWAVSQYIDGSQMKEKINNLKPSRKTAPAKAPNDVFIGTSPYNYPLKPIAPRLSPLHCMAHHRCAETMHNRCGTHQHTILDAGVMRSIDPRFVHEPIHPEDFDGAFAGYLHPACIVADESSPGSRSSSRPTSRPASRTSRRSTTRISNDERLHCHHRPLYYPFCNPTMYHMLPTTSYAKRHSSRSKVATSKDSTDSGNDR